MTADDRDKDRGAPRTDSTAPRLAIQHLGFENGGAGRISGPADVDGQRTAAPAPRRDRPRSAVSARGVVLTFRRI
ncbi:hypothetical protein [Streptomyces shenzhenensis]|uniref:hypothetical protein n=1 Tax=Streptomyces shenzhenensis TaxID=943815 RepID=UPI0015F040AC|nr:hypothetical protein [Streptomyces shenzhenensis]